MTAVKATLVRKKHSNHHPSHCLCITTQITLIILSTYFSVFVGYNDITPLYSKHSPRNFTPSLIGYFLAEVLFVKGVGVVLVIPLMTKVLKWSDLSISITGAVVTIGFYIFLGLASTKWMMFIGKLLRAFIDCYQLYLCIWKEENFNVIVERKVPGGGGGGGWGGAPIYKHSAPKGVVFDLPSSQMGIDFYYFGLKLVSFAC